VWICTVCNQPVAKPDKKKSCPSGHALFDWHIVGKTRELNIVLAFFWGIIFAAGTALLVAALGLIFANMAGSKHETRGGDIGIVIAAIWLPIYILVAFRRAAHWKRQGGAVTRLAPRAIGMALGSIVTFCVIIMLAVGRR
jgi:hypothetical protein